MHLQIAYITYIAAGLLKLTYYRITFYKFHHFISNIRFDINPQISLIFNAPPG